MKYRPLDLGRWLLWGATALVFIAAPHVVKGGFAPMMIQMGTMMGGPRPERDRDMPLAGQRPRGPGRGAAADREAPVARERPQRPGNRTRRPAPDGAPRRLTASARRRRPGDARRLRRKPPTSCRKYSPRRASDRGAKSRRGSAPGG